MEKSVGFSNLSPLYYRSFSAGEEDSARGVVAGPSRVPPLRVSKFEQDHQPALATALGAFTVVGMLVLIWVLDGPAFPAGFWAILVGFPALFSTLMYLHARFGRNAPKEVYIDADTGNVQLDREAVASLADFYAPRLLKDEWVTIRTAITEERKRMRVIYVERVNADPFQLFTYPVAYQLQQRLPQIADHLNALITEYNYRREVRRWLDEREAQQAPYRRPEAPE